MQLDELKQNMSLLEQVLAKSSAEITINVSASETAKNKLLRYFGRAVKNNIILFVVFGCLWIGNVDFWPLPWFFKPFIVIMSLISGGWYLFLYLRLMSLNIALVTPAELFAETTKIKIFTLSGEIFFVVVLAVFFTLMLPPVLGAKPLVFWTIIVTLVIGVAIKIIYGVPRYVKLFRDLNSIK